MTVRQYKRSALGASHNLEIKPGTLLINGSIKGYDDYDRSMPAWQRSQRSRSYSDLLQWYSTTKTGLPKLTLRQRVTKPLNWLRRLARRTFRR